MEGRWLAYVIISLFLVSCAGSGEGLDENGNPIGSGNNSTELEATLSSIQTNIFDAKCIKCHAGAGAPQGLMLDSGNSFDMLVGMPSSEDSSLDLVTPSDADNSYIVVKIVESDPQRLGARMPQDGPPYLSDEEIQAIRDWITAGATNN